MHKSPFFIWYDCRKYVSWYISTWHIGLGETDAFAIWLFMITCTLFWDSFDHLPGCSWDCPANLAPTCYPTGDLAGSLQHNSAPVPFSATVCAICENRDNRIIWHALMKQTFIIHWLDYIAACLELFRLPNMLERDAGTRGSQSSCLIVDTTHSTWRT